MIKTLQKKFILTAMTAITVLLVVLLGSINTVNIVSNERQLDNMLLSVAESGPFDMFDFSPGKVNYFRFFTPPVNEDTLNTAVYFTAKVYGDMITGLDLTHISTVSSKQAASLISRAYSSGESAGKIESFKYKAAATADGLGTAYIFIDASTQWYSELRIIVLSLLGGALCWGLMFLFVWFLSKRAIRPIAENMDKQKRFITDAGHEIKTPLAIILANTEAMELHNGENKWSKNIREQTERLSGLMQNLLTLSKADESKDLTMTEIDLSIAVSNSVSAFTESAYINKTFFECSVENSITVRGNSDYTQRVLSILLDNAVKYSMPGTSIGVYLTKSGKGAELSVYNTCESLPSCKAEMLFDRFYRSDSSRNQSGGYGIGLSAALAIAEIHNWQIYADYLNDNVIRFTIKFYSK